MSCISAIDLEAYRRAVEQHAIVAITDRRGIIVEVNDRFCQISGFARSELVGHTHALVNSGHHPREFWRELWSTIASGQVWHGEICNRARDGSIYWVDSTIVPLQRSDGRIYGYMAVRHPISELQRIRKLNQSLEHSDAFKESVLNSVAYAIVGTAADRLISVFNRGAERLLGYEARELVGRVAIDTICEPAELHTLRTLREQGVSAFEGEWTFIRRDGERVPVFISISAMHDREGFFSGYIGVARDISQSKRTEQALRLSEQKFRSLFEAAPLAITRNDPRDGRILEANAAFYAMTGYGPEDLGRLSFATLSPARTAPEEERDVRDAEDHASAAPLERHYVRKDGSLLPVLMSRMRSIDEQGQGSVWTIAQDISFRKEMELELRYAAQTDRLTGLANRALLVQQLERCIRLARASPAFTFALLFLDLDHFKVINDSLGHAAGDRILKVVADRLRSSLRGHDVVARSTFQAARLGGDEFVVLMHNIASLKQAALIAGRVLEAMSAPAELADREIRLTVSIGIVTSQWGHQTVDEYLRDADTAMYEAKRKGRGRYAIFDERMRDRAVRARLIQTELRDALHRSQLHLAYQPILSLQGGCLRGCEALLRWQHPELGVIAPSEFIAIAEDTGLIAELGDWVLRSACEQFTAWRRQLAERAPPSFNVNISRAELMLEGLPQRVRQVLAEHDIEPGCLHLEITETAVMGDAELSRRALQALREIGVKVDLDDFGTGYSSLASIQDLPLDVIKIDRSFVQSLDSDQRAFAIIEAVVRVAHQLDCEVIAEGIETPYQLERLQQLGCTLGQGFLFAPPLAAAKFEAWIPESRPQPTAAPSSVAPRLAV